MEHKTLKALEDLTGILVSVNVAVPVIGTTILAIAGIIRAVTGRGPTLRQVADMLEEQIGKNDDTINAEIRRLRALGD